MCLTSWLRAAVGDQHRVGRLDDHHVVQADDADQAAAWRAPACCGCRRSITSPTAALPCGVLRQHLPHGVPGAQVGPAGGQRHHAASSKSDCRGTSPSPRSRSTRTARPRTLRLSGRTKLGVACAALPGRARGAGDVGAEALERGQPHRRLQHEHAAVPEVAALGAGSARRWPGRASRRSRDTRRRRRAGRRPRM